MADIIDAVGGINAGGLADDAMGTGGTPTGLLIENGEYYNVNPYEYYSMCGFTQDNILYVSDAIYPSNVEGLNLRCAISFGPALIINGQPMHQQGQKKIISQMLSRVCISSHCAKSLH